MRTQGPVRGAGERGARRGGAGGLQRLPAAPLRARAPQALRRLRAGRRAPARRRQGCAARAAAAPAAGAAASAAGPVLKAKPSMCPHATCRRLCWPFHTLPCMPLLSGYLETDRAAMSSGGTWHAATTCHMKKMLHGAGGGPPLLAVQPVDNLPGRPGVGPGQPAPALPAPGWLHCRRRPPRADRPVGSLHDSVYANSLSTGPCLAGAGGMREQLSRSLVTHQVPWRVHGSSSITRRCLGSA